MLSSEQGVYVAESVASKNTRQAKGRFRMYEDHNDMVVIIPFHLFLLLFLLLLPPDVIFICNCVSLPGMMSILISL
jgi:hypothetical protein